MSKTQPTPTIHCAYVFGRDNKEHLPLSTKDFCSEDFHQNRKKPETEDYAYAAPGHRLNKGLLAERRRHRLIETITTNTKR